MVGKHATEPIEGSATMIVYCLKAIFSALPSLIDQLLLIGLTQLKLSPMIDFLRYESFHKVHLAHLFCAT